MTANRAARESVASDGRTGARDDALRETARLLEDAQALAHVGSWVTSLGAAPSIAWSREALRILGFPDGADPSIDAFYARIHPDDQPRVRAARRGLIEHRAPYAVRYRFVRPDGDVRILDAKASIDQHDPERPKMFGVFCDVTEHVRLVDQLRTAKARFDRLSESGILGIMVGDLHGGIAEANDACAELLGYARDELTNGSVAWPQLLAPELHQSLPEKRRALAEKGIAPPVETELVRKDGSRLPVLLGVAMLDPPSCIAFIADLRELKRAEAAVRERDEQLRQAQKMEAIGRLAGGVAHDFNNLLSVILTTADLALDDLPANDAIRDDFAEIRAAGERAADLTRKLLAFSRRQVLAPRVLDVNETLAGLEGLLRRIVGEDVRVVLRLAPSLGKVNVDPTQIEQVVFNLAVNARDAMPGGGTLAIETANGREPGTVELTVRDTGCGMDEPTKERIFEPFFTTKPAGKGTGLGLSTVLGIVQQSGGRIDVASAPGRGASFVITLPRATHEAIGRSVGPPAPRRTPIGTETILVVEDDTQVRAAVTTTLRRAGYRVLDARNVGDALRLAESENEHVDLVLTDLVLPAMRGTLLAKRIGALQPDARLLLMSGYPDVDPGDGDALAGAPLLRKPIRPDALLVEVRAAIASAPACGALPSDEASEPPSSGGGDRAALQILVVEPDRETARVLAAALRRDGFRVLEAVGATAATRLLRERSVDAVYIGSCRERQAALAIATAARSAQPSARIVAASDRRTDAELVERGCAIARFPIDYDALLAALVPEDRREPASR